MIDERACIECKKTKPFWEFRRGGSMFLSTSCNDCCWKDYIRTSVPLIYSKPPNKIRRIINRIKVPKVAIVKEKKVKEKNKAEKIKPERPRKEHRPRELNPFKRRERYEKWILEHPEGKKSRELRAIRVIDAGGKAIGWREWSAILKKYGNKCLRCGESYERLTQDHILPVSLGGKTIPENIQPLCKSCNSSKNNRHVDYRPIFNHSV